jgi:hypothetical protein
MRISIVVMLIRIWIGVNMEIQIRIRIVIKTMPPIRKHRNTGPEEALYP